MSFSHQNGDNIVSGDFSGLERLLKNLKEKYYVDIGILGAAAKAESGGITLAGIGAVHEFGTDKAGRGNKTVIPERSFLRMPLESGQEEIEKQIEPKLKELISSGDIKGIYKLIGIAGESRVQEAFQSGGFGKWPANAESTILQKGSDSPLIDDGTLRKSITSRVGSNK